MFRNAAPILILSVALAACGSTREKETKGAAVEDRGAAAEEGTRAYGTGDQARSAMEELNDPGSPLAVRIIYFDYDSSEIPPEYRGTMEAHAGFLARHADLVVSLEGHADERGSREYNLALGERRAQSVKRQLAVLGAADAQIRTISYGEERPAATGHDESSWSQNRRVEIIY